MRGLVGVVGGMVEERSNEMKEFIEEKRHGMLLILCEESPLLAKGSCLEESICECCCLQHSLSQASPSPF